MGSSISINTSVWENLYSNMKAMLQYPDSVLVSIASSLISRDKYKKVLDYGFGSGSNLLYFLRRGFECSGAEVSGSAIRVTAERIAKEGFKADLKLIKDGTLSFKNGEFDVVIAWEVLCYNDWNTLAYAVSEINRVLKPRGLFLGNMITSGNVPLIMNSHSLGNGIYESVAEGQEGALLIAIDDEKKLRSVFPGRKLTIGKAGFEFKDKRRETWIVSYEK